MSTRVLRKVKRSQFRLYIDESRDHTYSQTEEPRSRYLGLTGCIVDLDYYFNVMQPRMEALKREHFREHYEKDPDTPIVFHRTDVMQRKRYFWPLKDELRRQAFNQGMLEFFGGQRYMLISVVLDKHLHLSRKGAEALHPYHYCLTAMLERYCGFLNFYNRKGDVMAEVRGKKEDTLLKAEFTRIYDGGTRFHQPTFFQQALTSQELKLKCKEENVCGLQLADLLAHPSKQDVLLSHGQDGCEDGSFGRAIREVIAKKYNRQVYQDRVHGYGKVLLH